MSEAITYDSALQNANPNCGEVFVPRAVYVHCFGGIGRTGTVVCCWLLKHGLANERNIFKFLKHLRQADAARSGRQAPENDTQRQFVLDWFFTTKPSEVRINDDWFIRLTGFSERSPSPVRQFLSVTRGKMTSRVKGKTYTCGHLELCSLAELRDRVHAPSARYACLKLSELVADVSQIHALPASAGALFQVASQFNLLEMACPDKTPEDGVGIYQHDHTQGPACAIACGAGTIYRNYFVPVDEQLGQSRELQLNCLADISNALGNSNDQLWRMKNGYALPSVNGLTRVDARLQTMSEAELDTLRSQLRIGVQRDTQVTLPGCSHLVTQAYCSAMPVSYSGLPDHLWNRFARLILEAAYEATLAAAVVNAGRTSNNTVYLTLLGGGVFGNDEIWITDAIYRACRLYKRYDLDVKIVSYQGSKRAVQALVERYS